MAPTGMLRISWNAKKSNQTALQEPDMNSVCKCHATFFRYVMRREKLEYLVKIGMIKGKCSRGKQCDKMLDGLKWVGK